MKSFYLENTLEVGLDEAGRGPMLGRVYIGAVIIPPDDTFNQTFIKDSKKLSERKRLMAYDFIKDNAIDYTTFFYDEKVIDEKNIFKATYDGMHKALDNLLVTPEHILVDGCYFKTYIKNDIVIPHICVESGDNKYRSIAAASIIAKVERDKYIYDLCDKNPELDEFYSIRTNKGYGTSKHIEGIKKNGISIWHRKTFGICKNYDEDILITNNITLDEKLAEGAKHAIDLSI